MSLWKMKTRGWLNQSGFPRAMSDVSDEQTRVVSNAITQRSIVEGFARDLDKLVKDLSLITVAYKDSVAAAINKCPAARQLVYESLLDNDYVICYNVKYMDALNSVWCVETLPGFVGFLRATYPTYRFDFPGRWADWSVKQYDLVRHALAHKVACSREMRECIDRLATIQRSIDQAKLSRGDEFPTHLITMAERVFMEGLETCPQVQNHIRKQKTSASPINNEQH